MDSSSSKSPSAVGLIVYVTVMTTMMMSAVDVSATRLNVGDQKGWTSNVNYTLWAANHTFYLGDWLYFGYDRYQNDVLQVNETSYETCNAENPLHNYTTGAGREVVQLNVTGDYYFISSKGYCYSGTKLHVHVIDLPPRPQPDPVKSRGLRFAVGRTQVFMSMIVAVAAIWDSLILCV
ncbi:early nodulin-like protein 17 [Rutidosis leptorrhynchoides]|uniref:early nodulin-like protein 17 n=1 Tax=Rutidosis leptorrhynchoides TaxID=125765 RepID=UPI003A98F3DB